MMFFLHKDYHGDKAALEEPVQLGTVAVWQQDGIKFAGYRQTAAGITEEVNDRHTMNSETDTTDETYKAMSKAFNRLAFVFGDEETEKGPVQVHVPPASQRRCRWTRACELWLRKPREQCSDFMQVP